jgi:polar amino acid transport system substrate-binding protein
MPKKPSRTERKMIMKRKTLLCLALLTLCLPTSLLFAQEKEIKLNTAFVPPVRTIFESLMKEAFKRNDLVVVVQAPPAERALQQANDGTDDGDGPRIAGLSAKYPNLIQVSEKVIDTEFVAFTRSVKFEPNGWESVKPYRVGIVTGWKILEDNLAGAKSLEKVANAETLFKLLANDRIDVAVIGKLDGMSAIKQLDLKDITALSPPLAVKEMYLYLNKKHEALASRIDASLKEMKADGTYQKIFDQAQ